MGEAPVGALDSTQCGSGIGHGIMATTITNLEFCGMCLLVIRMIECACVLHKIQTFFFWDMRGFYSSRLCCSTFLFCLLCPAVAVLLCTTFLLCVAEIQPLPDDF